MAVVLPLPSSIPQTSSAIAQTNIFPGAAVAQSADKASLAGNGVLATHVANLGARAKGVASLVASGVVFLDDWTLATGAPRLRAGATYFVGPNGTLALSGSQPVGIATAINTLSVTIQSQSAGASVNSIASLQSQISSLASQVSSLSRNTAMIFGGTFAISNGVNSGSVTGLGVSFMPTKAIVVVRKQSGDLNIFATVVDGTITQAGFDFVLSSLTDNANYKLDFVMLP